MHISFLANNMHLLDEVNDIWFSEWNHFSTNSDRETCRVALRRMCNEVTIPTVIVAIEQGELIGTAALVQNDMKDRTDLNPWLASLYVKKNHRRFGHGRKLIEDVESIAGRLGTAKLYLYTEHQDKYYENLGWKAIDYPIYMNSKVAVMSKEILTRQKNETVLGSLVKNEI